MLTYEPKSLNYRYIILLGMLNLTIYLASVSMAFKIVAIGPFLIPGPPFIFPITYILLDIITEVYGYKIARSIIWTTLICQFLYALFVFLLLKLPYQNPLDTQHYAFVFGHTLRFVCSGFLAVSASSFANAVIFSKLKVFLHGKHFWLRSVISSLISGLILVGIIMLVGYSAVMSGATLLKMFLTVYLLEVVYSLILAAPGQLAASALKIIENVDVYDLNISYNPFSLK